MAPSKEKVEWIKNTLTRLEHWTNEEPDLQARIAASRAHDEPLGHQSWDKEASIQRSQYLINDNTAETAQLYESPNIVDDEHISIGSSETGLEKGESGSDYQDAGSEYQDDGGQKVNTVLNTSDIA